MEQQTEPAAYDPNGPGSRENQAEAAKAMNPAHGRIAGRPCRYGSRFHGLPFQRKRQVAKKPSAAIVHRKTVAFQRRINRSISHVDPGLRSIVPATVAAGKVDRLQRPRPRLNRLWPGARLAGEDLRQPAALRSEQNCRVTGMWTFRLVRLGALRCPVAGDCTMTWRSCRLQRPRQVTCGT